MTNYKTYPPVSARELSLGYQAPAKRPVRVELFSLFKILRPQSKQLPLPLNETSFRRH